MRPGKSLWAVPLHTILWGVLWIQIMILCFLALKLHRRSEGMQDCATNSLTFQSQLDAARDGLFLARTQMREAEEEKSRILIELEDVAARLNNIVGQKGKLKVEIVSLIDNYIALKGELKNMQGQVELTRSQAIALEGQGHQVEQTLGALHSTLKSLDISSPPTVSGQGKPRAAA